MERDGWKLQESSRADMDQLMKWFGDAEAIKVWGGPRFGYPFSKSSFLRDCHWRKMPTYSLRNPEGDLAAFGQFYERLGRINLARLVVSPGMRGQGIGKRLIQGLLEAGRETYESSEYSLFVYRDNAAALQCYQSMGFEIADFPEDAPLQDECFYLTRSVSTQ
jgi:ribosomal protein S18 acetylase RimI-like enzyme